MACRPDHIRLNWHAPEWAVPDNWIQRGDWSLMRSEYVEGPFTQIDMGSTYNGEASGFFEDFNVVPDTEYFYYIELAYTSSGVLFQTESTVVGASVCDLPERGPMDVAFIVDNTGSMGATLGTAIYELRDKISGILDKIAASSGTVPDFRLALVTPDNDTVNVRVNFTPDRSVFLTALNDSALMKFGYGNPESTDECLNTVVNGLWECHRNPGVFCNGNPETQTGDFFPPFGLNAPVGNEEGTPRSALKILILITDQVPGGFCDEFTAQIQANAEIYAAMARCNDIRIMAIQIGSEPNLQEVMETYASMTGGWHVTLPSNGAGLEPAILDILYSPLPGYESPEPNCQNFGPVGPCNL